MFASGFGTTRGWQVLRFGAVAGLVAAHYLLAVLSTREKSVTYDEIAHVTAGCSYWHYNDYRLQPENGNLPQRWCALPIVASGIAKLPSSDHPAWQTSDVWTLGDAFFHRLGNPVERMLLYGRSFAALWGVGICLVVYFWSRSLFGEVGGLISLASCAFCPTLLANGPLMTSDACLAFFLTLSMWLIWSLLHRITPLRVVAAMLVIGLLFIAKFSAVLVLPMTVVLLVVRARSKEPLVISGFGQAWMIAPVGKRLAASLAVGALCTLSALATVWLAYGGRYDHAATGALPEGGYYKRDSLKGVLRFVPGQSGRVIAALGSRRILPESYLFGAAFILDHQHRLAFFNGQYSRQGWLAFFPFCFSTKTPLALFGLLALSAVAMWQSGGKSESDSAEKQTDNRCWYRLTPLWALLGVYWLVSLSGSLNIGHRHLLATYPAVHILAGGAGLWLARSRVGTSIVVLLVAWLAFDSFAAYPHYLAYFNPFVPQKQAYQHLVDSSLDWGQDLPGLKQWLDQHNAGESQSPLYLVYFGKGDPSYYAISASSLNRVTATGKEYQPGLYCISATALQAVYELKPGRWNRQYEAEYQSARQACDSLKSLAQDAAPVATFDTTKLAEAQAALDYWRYLRLLSYLRQRKPDDEVGYSILIYRLSSADLDEAFDGPPKELQSRPSLEMGSRR